MLRDEAERIARDAAESAVTNVFLQLGINVEDPNQVVQFQKDFNAMREFVATFNRVRSQGLAAMVVLLIGAAVTAFWVGVKASLP